VIRLLNAYFPRRILTLILSESFLTMLALTAAVSASSRSDLELVLTYEQGFLKIVVVSAVCLLCMYYYDLYDSSILQSLVEVTTRLIQGLGTACLVMGLLYYVYPTLQLGPRTFLVGISLVGACLMGSRRLFFTVNRSARFAERAILLGSGDLAHSLAEEIKRRPEVGIRLVGYISDSPDEHLDDMRCLGGVADLAEKTRGLRANRVIVAMTDRRGRLPVEQLLQLKTGGVLVQDGVEVFERITGKVPLYSIRLSWLVFSPGFCVSKLMLAKKRLFSIIVSAFGLVVAAPVMALIALAIRLDSEGPVIFRQRRVGEGGRLFTLYKFRTMRHQVEADGNFRPAKKNDERFTRVGGWLRRMRLDELPQLYNILKGDMDFVGPRPFVPNQEEECVREIPLYAQRWSVKPGATGWAQIHRGYCATLEDNIEKLAYDLYYIKNMSLGLDLLIIFQTIKISLLGRGGC
jgi:sugar transferase (PEP-CTERM system associated)